MKNKISLIMSLAIIASSMIVTASAVPAQMPGNNTNNIGTGVSAGTTTIYPSNVNTDDSDLEFTIINSSEENEEVLNNAKNHISSIINTANTVSTNKDNYTIVQKNDYMLWIYNNTGYEPTGIMWEDRAHSVLSIQFCQIENMNVMAIVTDIATNDVMLCDTDALVTVLDFDKADIPAVNTLDNWLGHYDDIIMKNKYETDKKVITILGSKFQELTIGSYEFPSYYTVNWFVDSYDSDLCFEDATLTMYDRENSTPYVLNIITDNKVNVNYIITEDYPEKEDLIKDEVAEPIYGDCNLDNEVDIRDVTALNQHIIKIIDFSEQQTLNADVSYDSQIDIADLGQLKKYILRLVEKDNLGPKNAA